MVNSISLTNITFFFASLIILHCSHSVENKYELPDCAVLQSGIINANRQIICTELNKMMTDLNPKITSDDEWGHRKNLDKLINRINESCDNVDSELLHYAGIETNPPQSEIKLTTDSSGVTIDIIVDISTPNNDILGCSGVH